MSACGLTCKSPNQFSLFLLIVALAVVVVVVVTHKWANKNKNMLPSTTLFIFGTRVTVLGTCFYTHPFQKPYFLYQWFRLNILVKVVSWSLLGQARPLWKQVTYILRFAWSLAEMGPSLNSNHHGQVKLVQISARHGARNVVRKTSDVCSNLTYNIHLNNIRLNCGLHAKRLFIL